MREMRRGRFRRHVRVSVFAPKKPCRGSCPKNSHLTLLNRQLATKREILRLLARAELRAKLTPLAAAASRGALFDARLFEAALWRVVPRLASARFGGKGEVASLNWWRENGV